MAFSKEVPKWQKRGQKRTNFDSFSEKGTEKLRGTNLSSLDFTAGKNKFSSILNDDLLLEKLRNNSFYHRKNQKSLVLLAERSYE